jgi:TetR/AcrR family transcriptional regulator of autoinduction and epiphytic fitness
VGETNVTDRRVERANRTRDSVVDALLDLINEGNLRPTAREIAARAGVSLRSLYVHFDDVDALYHAAAIRNGLRLQEHCRELLTTGPFEDRLAAFLERRSVFYEVGRNVRHAALLQEPFSPALRSILEEGRKAGRAELEAVFEPELAAGDRDQRLAALNLVTNWPAWNVLRIQHAMTIEAARSLMSDLVHVVLGQPLPSDPTASTVSTPSPATDRPTPESNS